MKTPAASGREKHLRSPPRERALRHVSASLHPPFLPRRDNANPRRVLRKHVLRGAHHPRRVCISIARQIPDAQSPFGDIVFSVFYKLGGNWSDDAHRCENLHARSTRTTDGEIVNPILNIKDLRAFVSLYNKRSFSHTATDLV